MHIMWYPDKNDPLPADLTDLQIPVVHHDIAQQLYEAAVNLPPGNVELDAAVERYEREVLDD